MMRSHYLDRNAGTETPSNLVFVDTETIAEPSAAMPRVELHRLRLWCAIHVRMENGKGVSHTIQYGYTAAEFWNWFDSCLVSKKKTWLFAHNAHFDLTQLDFWEQLDSGRYTIAPLLSRPNPETGERKSTWRGSLCLESSPFFVYCRKDRQTINIVDTCNYWRMPLAELGEAVGLPKLPMPGPDATDEDWRTYCHRDVEIILRAVVSLIQEWRANDCGVFQATAPMLAMTSFRHMCKLGSPNCRKLDIVCEPGSPAHDLERESYYGGRVTCFTVGKRTGKFYYLDVNSLYPYVMHEHSFPRCRMFNRDSPSIAELEPAARVYGTIAEVLIDSRCEAFPLRIDGTQHHCTGHYWTVLCGPELSRALDSGSVLRAARVQYYSVAAYFREWVATWYAAKLRGLREVGAGSPLYRLSKIVLNSLYGKFAQRGRRWSERLGTIPLERWGGYARSNPETLEIEKCRGVAGYEQVLTEEGEPAHAFPAISAFVAAYAREYMLHLIAVAGEDNVLYQAVDALIVTEEGYERLKASAYIDPFAMGMLKVVGEYGEVEIRGANYYALDGKVTAAGLVGLAEDCRRNGKEPRLFQTVGETISGKPDGSIAVKPMPEPSFTPDYRGVVGPDGRWRPYRLTFDPDFTDRPPRFGWRFADSTDTEQVRTLRAAEL